MNQTDYPHEAWERLGRAVRERRLDLDYTQPGLAAAGGPSTSMISKIESARAYPYGDRVIIRLEDALRLKRGSVKAFLNGDQATLAESTSDTETPGGRSGFHEYPEIVGADLFFRYIWDYDGPGATELDKQIAIRSVQNVREAAQTAAAGQAELRRA